MFHSRRSAIVSTPPSFSRKDFALLSNTPSVYSKFALCEYSVVVVNILFHVSSALDVGGASLDLSLASSMPESKNL